MLRLFRKRRAQQIHQLVFAIAPGRDGLDIGLHLADIRRCLLGLSRRNEPFEHGQMVAHVVLVDGRLRLHAAQRVHLRLRLRPFDLQHGALQLCLIAALCLRVVGSEKRHVKRNEQRRERFVDGADAGIERI